MHGAFLTGRVIVGLYYLSAAAMTHFAGLSTAAGYAASKGVPFPTVAVIGSGLLLVVAGLTLLTGWHPKVGVAALVLFFVPVTFMMHAFWRISDPMARMAEMVNFTKNLALLGSSLMFLAIPEPWPLSVHPRARVRAEAHA